MSLKINSEIPAVYRAGFLKFSPALVSVCMSALLLACGHTPSPRDIAPGASFTTEILPDATKLFVYTERRQMLDEEIEEMNELAARRGDARRPKVSPVRSAQALRRNLEAMLAQNNYCRDGYLVLEQYEERKGRVIRGECKDAASASDRQRYSELPK
jgi:hypothetical protein